MVPNSTEYGFGGHLSSEFPSQIIVDVTEFCNLACEHCPQKEFSKSGAFGARHLDFTVHKKLVDEVASDGRGYCRYLRYAAQGEPLLHPNFVEMMEYASKYAQTSINVTTNGVLLTEKKAKMLLNAGVNVFDISIDANTPEVYAAVRKKGDLNITKPNVLRLIDLIKKNNYKAKVVVSFVEQPLNSHESNSFERFWRQAGADYVVVRRLHSCAGIKKEVAAEMRKMKSQHRRPCLYPWERLVLSPTGQIGFCPADWRYKAKIAHLKNTTIKEIWQGEFMRTLRQAHLDNDYSNHSFCGQCPDWSVIKWPHEGRAYSDMMAEFARPNVFDVKG